MNLMAGLPAEELPVTVVEMRNALDRMVHEGAKLGLETRAQVIAFFGEENASIINQFFDMWEKFRDSLYAAADRVVKEEEENAKERFLAEYTAFLERMRVVNAKFIALCLEKYQKLTAKRDAG